jgi:hypothetical protein
MGGDSQSLLSSQQLSLRQQSNLRHSKKGKGPATTPSDAYTPLREDTTGSTDVLRLSGGRIKTIITFDELSDDNDIESPIRAAKVGVSHLLLQMPLVCCLTNAFLAQKDR